MEEDKKQKEVDIQAVVRPEAFDSSAPESSTIAASISKRKVSAEKLLSNDSNGHIEEPSSSQARDLRKLVNYEDIPIWYQDNPNIRTGYRPVSNSNRLCFWSWTYIHNETFNIYSHLIPAVGFLLAQIYMENLVSVHFPNATAGDRIIFVFFLATATITLTLSFSYHTLMNHSIRISHLWLRLDYIGILVLTLGDFVSGIYLVFYCDPTLQKVYWTMIGTLSLITSVLVLHPRLQGLKFRTSRVIAFIGTGLSGFAPLGHGLVVYGWHYMWLASGMPYYLLEGALLAMGAIFYATRCPESLSPGRFDIWGCSHHLLHIFVVAATVVQLVGIWESFAYHYMHNPLCVLQ